MSTQGAGTTCEVKGGVMHQGWYWLGMLPICGLVGWVAVRRPLREYLEARDATSARELFRRQRERLELRFVLALMLQEPIEAARWDDADWQDEIVWARDRHTRRLLAMVAVRFATTPFDDDAEYATALFEFQRGRWHAEGRHLNAVLPTEVLLRHRQLEPIEPPQQRF